MGLELKKHNEEAYEKLMLDLQKNHLTTINHATGTGKSFIILKYLYENRDKRILYLCPTYPIFDQLVKKHMKTLGISINDFKKFDNILYRGLLNRSMEELADNYDIIICDEYHRLGAKKWGRQAQELKHFIETKYPEKVMIGLTATEIRYLDDERNMNDELFDMNCASYLSLADAILGGILPAPIYVNSTLFIEKETTYLKSKIDKNVYYEHDKQQFRSAIDGVEATLKKEDELKRISKFIKKDDCKYVLFNSTIESIKKNKAKMSKIFGTNDIRFYEIHSKQSRSKNERILDEFSDAKTGINVLCVVDILNEGVHVDDIDGIIMMRRTTSPIIYFQQLGRLLSFSSRNDELVVLDMVGNLVNHSVIYDLYRDVQERARQLIVSDPANKEKYKTILKRFRIIDSTSNLYDQIQNVNDSLSHEKIINQRISTAVGILLGEIDATTAEAIQAHIDLFTYESYITLGMFKQLYDLNIIKPGIFNMTPLEFEKKLNGYDNLNKAKERYFDSLVDSVEQHYQIYGRIPSALSDNPDEKALAEEVTEASSRFRPHLIKRLYSLVKCDKSLTAYDLVYYGLNLSTRRYGELKEQLTTNKNVVINDNVVRFLKKHANYDYVFEIIYDRYRGEKAKQFNDNVGKQVIEFAKSHDGNLPTYDSDDPKEQQLFLKFNSKSDGYKSRYMTIILSQKYMIYDADEEEEKEVIDKVASEILEFIDKNHRYPDRRPGEERIRMKYTSFKRYFSKYGYLEKFNKLLKLKQYEDAVSRANEVFESLIDFIKSNHGDLPSTNVDDIIEVELARNYNKYKKYFTDKQNIEINNTICECRKYATNVIDDYILFIKRNHRYPLLDADDEKEKEIAKRYNRCIGQIDPSDKKRIERAFSYRDQYENRKNTFIELLKKGDNK